ncbi:MAG TPA: NAD(P)H-binding protein [Actinomycetota bacterium]|nr:NAD(P)H-binding protein [Actinomycetota bacterium]
MIMVTGASGAIGSRLVDRLLAEGERPLAAGRRPEALGERFPGAEARELDALRPETLPPALEGVRTLYYFIHSMEPGAESFDERDRVAALNVARSAKASGVERIVYLGGLGEEDETLSRHLSSRHETGRVLAEEGPSLVELRAAMVVGAQSASFRMLRDLVHRLPAMIVPRWVETRSQPIAIRDVLAYLSAARTTPLDGQRTLIEIGGADVLTYREMIETLGRIEGRRRLVVGVPLLTPRLSSLWCGLTTSVSASVARPLIMGMTHETVVRTEEARRRFPDIRPMGFEDALRRALEGE